MRKITLRDLLLGLIVVLVLAVNVYQVVRSHMDTAANGSHMDPLPKHVLRRRHGQPHKRNDARAVMPDNAGQQSQEAVEEEEEEDDDGYAEDLEEEHAENMRAHVHKQQGKKIPHGRKNVKSADELLNNPAIADMLGLGGPTAVRVFAADAEEHRFWKWSMDPGKKMCLHRAQLEQIWMIDCKPEHDTAQGWFVSDRGHIGIRHADSDFCMAVDTEQQLRLYPCHEDSPTQQWDFVMGTGVVQKSSGLCISEKVGMTPVYGLPCTNSTSQWFFEVYENYIPVLADKLLEWFAVRREAKLDVARKALHETVDRLSQHIPPKPTSKRRAVVFYGEAAFMGFTTQLHWWLLAWQRTGLSEASQKFDVIVLGDARLFMQLKRMWPSCELRSFDTTTTPPPDDSAGVCWFFEFVGASRRDKTTVDGYFNRFRLIFFLF